MERFWGTFTEWYEASSFRGFKDWENTHRYCETFEVYYNFIRPTAPFTLDGKPVTPAGAAGFKHVGCWSTLVGWIRNYLN